MQSQSNPLSSSRGRWLMSLLAAVAVGGGSLYFKETFRPWLASAAPQRDESPGGYHSHAEFEKECQHCHAPVHCINPTGCQECHKELAWRWAQASDLPASLPGPTRCQTCRDERNGRDAIISRFFPLVTLERACLARHRQGYAEGDLGLVGDLAQQPEGWSTASDRRGQPNWISDYSRSRTNVMRGTGVR